MNITRSEEHTSELQSPYDIVCRLLLEKKKENDYNFDLTLLNELYLVLSTAIGFRMSPLPAITLDLTDSHARQVLFLFFVFNDAPPTETYTLSLLDALPI